MPLEFTFFAAFIAATCLIGEMYLKQVRTALEEFKEFLDTPEVLSESTPEHAHGWRCIGVYGNITIWGKPSLTGELVVHCCKGRQTPESRGCDGSCLLRDAWFHRLHAPIITSTTCGASNHAERQQESSRPSQMTPSPLNNTVESSNADCPRAELD